MKKRVVPTIKVYNIPYTAAFRLLLTWLPGLVVCRAASSGNSVIVGLDLLQFSAWSDPPTAELAGARGDDVLDVLATLRAAEGCGQGYDAAQHGAIDCDRAWEHYGVNCSVLSAAYGWNCWCCRCPGDTVVRSNAAGEVLATESWSSRAGATCGERRAPDASPNPNLSRAAPKSKGCLAVVDAVRHGAKDCDDAWDVFRVNCSNLGSQYGWDCSGCRCPGDDTTITGVNGSPVARASTSAVASSSCAVGVDAERYGVPDCDSAWDRYRTSCSELVRTFGWDCTGCRCPGDNSSAARAHGAATGSNGAATSVASGDSGAVAPANGVAPGSNGAAASPASGSTGCLALVDADRYGVDSCDSAWDRYRTTCDDLVGTYGWDCSGCSCPGDGASGSFTASSTFTSSTAAAADEAPRSAHSGEQLPTTQGPHTAPDAAAAPRSANSGEAAPPLTLRPRSAPDAVAPPQGADPEPASPPTTPRQQRALDEAAAPQSGNASGGPQTATRPSIASGAAATPKSANAGSWPPATPGPRTPSTDGMPPRDTDASNGPPTTRPASDASAESPWSAGIAGVARPTMAVPLGVSGAAQSPLPSADAGESPLPLTPRPRSDGSTPTAPQGAGAREAPPTTPRPPCKRHAVQAPGTSGDPGEDASTTRSTDPGAKPATPTPHGVSEAAVATQGAHPNEEPPPALRPRGAGAARSADTQQVAPTSPRPASDAVPAPHSADPGEAPMTPRAHGVPESAKTTQSAGMSHRRSCFKSLDYTQHGVVDCDHAWEVYRTTCYELAASFGWDCEGCSCPGDPDFDSNRVAQSPMTAPTPWPTMLPTGRPTPHPTRSPTLKPSPLPSIPEVYAVQAVLSMTTSASEAVLEPIAIRAFTTVFLLPESAVAVVISAAPESGRRLPAMQTYQVHWTAHGALEDMERLSALAEDVAADPANSALADKLSSLLSALGETFEPASMSLTPPTLEKVLAHAATPAPTGRSATPTPLPVDEDASGAPGPAGGLPAPQPTPAPSSVQGGVDAKGDPHMTNVRGQRFDLMLAGRHMLIQIPRAAGAKQARIERATLLQVEVNVSRQGRACGEMYIEHVNVTGRWAKERASQSGLGDFGGFQYYARDADTQRGANWEKFGAVDLKVVWGSTAVGKGNVSYLNVYARHLGQVKYAIGGILGEDDHTVASTPSAKCRKVIELQSLQSGGVVDEDSAASVAEAQML